MKTTLLLSVICLFLFSCTKSGGGGATPSSSVYTCVCKVVWSNTTGTITHDSTIKYPYGNVSIGTATNTCDSQLEYMVLRYGNATSSNPIGASCSLQ